MDDDREIRAMTSINQVLQGLDEAEVSRIIKWLADRHGVNVGKTAHQLPGTGTSSLPTGTFGSVAELFDAAGPSTEADKVLVVGYWFQQVQGLENFDSQQVNKELKNLGHGVANVTRAFSDLMSKRPRLALQTYKGGSTKQARKKYRLTREGVLKVEQMLSSPPDDRTKEASS